MTFSPQLEARFEEVLRSCPPGHKRSALIPMLLFAQDEVGALTSEVVAEITRRLELKQVDVDEVISYYTMLRRETVGKYHLQICTNISCMLTGGLELWDHACKKLGIGNHEVTPDGLFSLEEVECIGACSWAPAMLVNYEFKHKVTLEDFDRLIDTLRKLQ